MRKIWIGFFFFALLLGACTAEEDPGPQTLRVMVHDSFAISDEVLAVFEIENNVTVEFLLAGDTGSALNKAILSKNAPLADVFYGVDNTFLSRALEAEIFERYAAPALARIPDHFKLDPGNRALPVDFGDVCLNYEVAYFEENDLPIPGQLEDLLKPEYKGLLVVQNPATSSPGMAFLLATIGYFGEDGYLDFWEGLVQNDVLVVGDWETAYYAEFTQWGGTRPLVVSYGSSPPFEVIFADPPVSEPPTGAITGEGTCFRQVEFVGILSGTENRTMAEKWVDFMLATEFQEDIPLQMYVFPVNPDAQLDERFVKYLAVPASPAFVSPAEIAAKRQIWLESWMMQVIRR